jgi:PAS domain S-box-containing protein
MFNQLAEFHSEPVSGHSPMKGHRVLVVDDDPIVRHAMSEVLTTSGYVCDQAGSAFEALEHLGKTSYACILTDLIMPEKSGLDLLNEVMAQFPDIAVILVSGQSDVNYVRRAMRSGAYDYMVKPSTAAELITTVQGALQRRAQYLQEQSDKAHLQERVEIGMVESLLFEDIVKGAIDGIMITDLKGRIIMVNPALERLTGYSRGELIGTLAPVFRDGGGTGPSGSSLAHSLAAHGSWSGEMFDRRKDQSRWYGHISISRVKDTEGRPFADVFIIRDITDKKFMERQLLKKLHDVQSTQDAAIIGFAKLAEYRDPETSYHLERVRNYCRILAGELARQGKHARIITDAYLDALYNACPLHDIGKVGIPDSILLKPGKLTPDEYQVMKKHPVIGGDTLASVEANLPGKSFLNMAKEIAYFHHEKFNGKGYPYALAGEDIPLAARIVAFADAYDALTSKRVYKDVVHPEESKQRLLVDRGLHFDPDIVDAFLAKEKDFKQVLGKYSDSKKR